MKRIILVMLALFLCRSMAVARDGTDFYYGEGEKHYMTRSYEDMMVTFSPTITKERYTSIVNSLSSFGATVDKKFYRNSNLIESEYVYFKLSRNNGEEIRTALLEYPEVLYADFMFENGLVGVSDKISVSLEPSNEEACIEAIRNAGCKIIKQKFRLPQFTYYYISCPKNMEAMTKANELFETGLFRHVQPDFFMTKLVYTNDPYWNLQWNMYNTGQTGGSSGADIHMNVAYDKMTKGNPNIRIAIVDDGVELTHDDLEDNLVSGFDAIVTSNNGDNITGENHGTLIAGIIGAVGDNNIGVTGIAPGCKIVPIRAAVVTGSSWATSADGIHLAADPNKGNADVINISWGTHVLGFTNQDVIDEIDYATTSGRGGLGCIVVCASGNGDVNNNNQAYSHLSFPANRWNVVAVGATDEDDEVTYYSNYGPGLTLVAPGGKNNATDIPTTDVNNSYAFDFGGTSAAAPHVAGAAALMLSVNPCLNWVDTRWLLMKSADKLSKVCHFSTVTDPWDEKYGYGRLNVNRAVEMAIDNDMFFNGISGTAGNTTNHGIMAFQPGCTPGSGGTYAGVERVEVNATVNYPYNPNASFHVDANGYSNATGTNNGRYEATVVSVSPTQATFRTHVYFCHFNMFSFPVNIWIPHSPSNVRFFAYGTENYMSTSLDFQNRTENNLVKSYRSVNPIRAGYSVTNSVPNGDYVLQSDNNVEFRSKEFVSLEPGFIVDANNSNNVFLARIGFATCSQYPNGLRRKDTTTQSQTEEYVWEEEAPEIGNVATSNTMQVYPNPNRGEFTIDFGNTGKYDVVVTDMLGRTAYKAQVNDRKTTIDLDESRLPGMYTIQITSNEVTTIKKITVIK